MTPESDLNTCFLSVILSSNKVRRSFELLQEEYYHGEGVKPRDGRSA